jgi:hypothetical protein
VLPKSGRSIPVKIVNEDSLSRDKVSLASKNKFASKEGDNKRDLDKDIAAAARLALGVEGLRPSNEARAEVARLPDTIIVRRVLAALHNDTNNEASSAAASNSKAAARVTLRDGVESDKEANFKANWQAKKGGHMREEAVWATKRKPNHAAHQGGGMPSPQVLTANEEANFEANWQAEKGGYPSGEAGWATKRKANHAAHQGGGTRSPQMLTALFGSTAKKGENRTGQKRCQFFTPPSPPSTTNRTTGPTSGLMAAMERRKSPRRPPRVGMATRLQAAARTARMAMRLHAWAPQNRH